MKLQIKMIKQLFYILCLVCVLTSCDNIVSQRSIILLLDIIPFCDRIHFSLYLHKGLMETQVRKLYGEPGYVFSINPDGNLIFNNNIDNKSESVTQSSIDNKYYPQITGYDSAPYPISNVVYIYLGGFDAIAYVYIDSTNVVENVYIGGS